MEGRDLWTRLIAKAYRQLSIVYSGKNKTYKIIVDHYYWPEMTVDIDQYVQNCITY